ncbi:hypothetical protein DLJ47_30480 [Micromonospora sp. S4605]|nr:hypothetical protein DLJ47_30480 [Micromonospora sp. S4605]
MHTSEKPLEPYGPVVDWAAKHVGQQDWTGDDHELVEPTYPYIRRVLKTATTVPVIPPNQK